MTTVGRLVRLHFAKTLQNLTHLPTPIATPLSIFSSATTQSNHATHLKPSEGASDEGRYGNITTTGPTTPEAFQTPSLETHRLSPAVTTVETITIVEMPAVIETEVTSEFLSSGILTSLIMTNTLTTAALVQIPAIMNPASFTTQTGEDNKPVRTITNFNGSPILVPKLSTVTDSRGIALTTVWTRVPITSKTTTYTNAQGLPTATATLYPGFPNIPGGRPANIVLASGSVSYFAVDLLPVLLTVLLLLPVQAVDAEIKQLLPYRYLVRFPSGCSAADSLYPRTGGLSGHLSGLRLFFRHGDAVSVLGDTLVVCATGLVALSGETIGLKLRGACLQWNTSTCLVTVAVFSGSARAAEALLGVMLVSLVLTMVTLSRSRTGVAAHPSSIASLCALLQLPDTVQLVRRVESRCDDQLGRSTIKLGWVDAGRRAENYGLVVVHTSPRLRDRGRRAGSSGTRKDEANRSAADRDGLCVTATRRAIQVCFLFVLSGLLTVVVYSENTEYDDPSASSFEWFMDSQDFGVGVLFACLGQMVSFGWDYFCGGM